MTAQFGVADSGVTVEIIPLLSAMGRAGRSDDVLYLTTFAYEEGKHADFFTRWLDTVTRDAGAIGEGAYATAGLARDVRGRASLGDGPPTR